LLQVFNKKNHFSQVLEINIGRVEFGTQNPLCHFLPNLTRLKEFTFIFNKYLQGSRLFNDYLCNNAPFKLQKLSVDDEYAQEELMPLEFQDDLFNFIKQHHSSLRQLEIDRTILNTEKQEYLLRMQLKSLALNSCLFVSDSNRKINVQNESIQKVTLSIQNEGEVDLANFLKNCTQISEISLYLADISAPLGFVISYHLPKLEKLTIESCLSFPIYIPSLNVLHLRYIESDEVTHQNIIALLLSCRQLKELKAHSNWLEDRDFAFALEHLNLDKLDLTDN
jgi:hypothetical protein